MTLNQAGVSILGQLASVVQQMDDTSFRKPNNLLQSATPGQHIRHMLEFFTGLMHGMHAGIINYDKRAHDPALENNRDLTIQLIGRLTSELAELPSDGPLILETSMDRQQDTWIRITTTRHRELAYVIDHAIHHMAILKPALKAIDPGLPVDENFGVAFSTSRFRKSQLAGQ